MDGNDNNAPIVELVIGLHFNSIIFSNREIFNFYDKVKELYPIIQEHPPLQFFGDQTSIGNPKNPDRLFHSRKFFLNSRENKLIQLQVDKVLFNWRKTDDSQQYPMFKEVLNEFLQISEMIKDINDISKNITLLEVTYVDHIFLDDFNKNDFNPTGILKLFDIQTPIENVGGTFVFPSPDINGKIIVNVKTALGKTDKKLLVLETNGRGQLLNFSIKDWFDQAHDSIHNLFFNIITEEAKLIWKI